MAHEHDQLNRMTLDHCVKCTICETQCPVARVTPLFPGPKFVGPQAERFRDGESVDMSIDYCSSCGICTQACPQGVKIAEMNTQARAVMKEEHMPLRDRLISQTTLMGAMMNPVAPLANAALGNGLVRSLVQATFKVAKDAPMPPAQKQTLAQWLRKRKPSTTPVTRGSVVFFSGCAGGYFEVETSKKSIEVLEHLGYEVLVPKQGCCGLAQQSNGLFDGARRSVMALCDDLLSAGELTIVSSSGSCTGMLKHEAHTILGIDDERLAKVGTRIRDISELLVELYDAGEFDPSQFRETNVTVPYHQPCQVKSQGMGMPAKTLMQLIPGVVVEESGQPCCGIAGTYGLKAEKYAIAQEVGRPVFEMIRATNENLATCDTETCRWQIRKGSGVNTIHPIELVHHALGLGTIPGI
ncbi:anaerobic glycerol-3-phosphate dehydrogenase subunit C [Aestuariimicrobium kwangyangense]|uniref:anaerobic glycerol-3-phosphate dehydrogenase subunit C n=1 Tax=Aestuariimicrobium kwangyangense TaxID=396389 RepID=UPI0003B51B82|nr:anaerobic glycerol-3-phosphate dehydrogenase subunit C [Aestuariimicrobium kwangyangense]